MRNESYLYGDLAATYRAPTKHLKSALTEYKINFNSSPQLFPRQKKSYFTDLKIKYILFNLGYK